jgi:hypothetical protein
MVKFFNQKEEVIEIELTPYGRQKLSEGEFSPSYYAFYDTGILYDGAHGGVSETQNQIVNRIKNSTPHLRPVTKFTTLRKSMISLSSANYKNYYSQQEEYCANYNRFLGKNSTFSDFAPSWEIVVTEDSDSRLTGSIQYKANNTLPEATADLDLIYTLHQNGDATSYTLENNKNITLDILELNTVFSVNGNFDVEVFKIDQKGQMQALGFINDKSVNAQGLTDQVDPTVLSNTIEGSNEEILYNFPILDDTYVEYYFEVLLDQEVPGVQMPSNSSIYKRNIDRNPGNICKVIQSTSEHFPIVD